MTDYIFYFVLIQIVLLVPSFYFYRFIFRKVGAVYFKTYSYIFAILIPVLLTWLFITINSEYIHPWIRSEEFNSQKWKSKTNLRYRMVNDIIDNQRLIGKTKEEVTQILGKDTEEGPCNKCIGYSTNEPDQGFSIDHEVLEINFDNQNKVISVRLNFW